MGLGVINLSLGCPTRSCSNKLAQLQKIVRMLKLYMKQVYISYLQEVNNKDADMTAWMRRLVYAFVVPL